MWFACRDSFPSENLPRSASTAQAGDDRSNARSLAGRARDPKLDRSGRRRVADGDGGDRPHLDHGGTMSHDRREFLSRVAAGAALGLFPLALDVPNALLASTPPDHP